MKYLILILLIVNPFTDLDKIAKVNKAKKEAKEAYLEGNYQLAHDTYQYLIDTLGVKENEVLLDFAHTQYQLKDTTNAVNNYQQLAQSADAHIASVAEQQLGQVFFDKKQYEPALEHYKNALRKNPANQDARYNYELLKKLIQQQKDQQKQDQQQNKDQQNQDKQDQNKDQQNKDDQNKDQQNKDQQNQEQKDKKDQQDQEQQQKDQEQKDQEQKDQEKEEGQKDNKKDEKKEEQEQQQKDGEESEKDKKEQPAPSPSDKLKEMNISEEKAKMILEAMKNNEVQYIQQNKRKATKKKDNGKPDW
ncbi:MAG: tetratricopeptide repeat protein [Cyclobacteriaceae bacterium]|nr:tetratricopeptide repeat protein [Cyclobacteriaceae bacterium]